MSSSKKYLPPPFIMSKIINPFLMMFGLVSILTVKGRKSGKLISTPVTPITYEGSIYLVAPRGETQWVRNIRIAKEGKLQVKGKGNAFKATEITGKLRDEVVLFYRKKVTIAEDQFRLLPDISDHPVFQITLKK
jgi:deazaflavin-dependent oxidoreductase (nitroreductase family)